MSLSNSRVKEWKPTPPVDALVRRGLPDSSRPPRNASAQALAHEVGDARRLVEGGHRGGHGRAAGEQLGQEGDRDGRCETDAHQDESPSLRVARSLLPAFHQTQHHDPWKKQISRHSAHFSVRTCRLSRKMRPKTVDFFGVV